MAQVDRGGKRASVVARPLYPLRAARMNPGHVHEAVAERKRETARIKESISGTVHMARGRTKGKDLSRHATPRQLPARVQISQSIIIFLPFCGIRLLHEPL